MARELPVCQNLLKVEASPSHSDTPHSVGFLWTSDHLVAEPITFTTNKQTNKQTNTRDEYLFPQ
jgi:hypothetical protein